MADVGERVGLAGGRIDGGDVVQLHVPLGDDGVIAVHVFAHPPVGGRLFHLGPVQALRMSRKVRRTARV